MILRLGALIEGIEPRTKATGLSNTKLEMPTEVPNYLGNLCRPRSPISGRLSPPTSTPGQIRRVRMHVSVAWNMNASMIFAWVHAFLTRYKPAMWGMHDDMRYAWQYEPDESLLIWHNMALQAVAKLENGYDATANDQNQLSWLLDEATKTAGLDPLRISRSTACPLLLWLPTALLCTTCSASNLNCFSESTRHGNDRAWHTWWGGSSDRGPNLPPFSHWRALAPPGITPAQQLQRMRSQNWER